MGSVIESSKDKIWKEYRFVVYLEKEKFIF